MDKGIILDVLKNWNIWEKKVDAGIEREVYIKLIYPYFERKEVIVVKGIRRSGKSTILKQLIYKLVKNGVDKKQILYLNLEDYNFANDLDIKLFDKVLKVYMEYSKNKKRTYFFIDEVQKISGWEKWVRTKYDLGENIKFVVTGSSASLLSRELSTLLTGRNISFKVMPLSYLEFLKFSKDKSLDLYLQFGGFPEVVLEEDKDKKKLLLQQYLTDIIHKDIVDRYNIRNARQLIQMVRYLVSAAGAKISMNKLAKVFGISNDTLSTYVGYMIDSFLLVEVTYFSYSAKIRHDVTKLPKLYVVDNGLINIATIKFSKNKGQMYENTVLIKLASIFDEISYWSELTSEVDFVVDKKAINVTATDKVPAREMLGVDTFCEKHKSFSQVIVTESLTEGNYIALEKFLRR